MTQVAVEWPQVCSLNPWTFSPSRILGKNGRSDLNKFQFASGPKEDSEQPETSISTLLYYTEEEAEPVLFSTDIKEDGKYDPAIAKFNAFFQKKTSFSSSTEGSSESEEQFITALSEMCKYDEMIHDQNHCRDMQHVALLHTSWLHKYHGIVWEVTHSFDNAWHLKSQKMVNGCCMLHYCTQVDYIHEYYGIEHWSYMTVLGLHDT